VVVLAAVLLAVNAKLFSDNVTAQKFMFNQFKREYFKSYDAAEEPKRFQIFVENLKLIDQRNADETGSAVHGITKFCDLSQDEFRGQFLTAKSSAGYSSALKKVVDYVAPVNATGLVDWTDKYTTAVKDQGYCGSCWAFSATEQVESDAMRVLGSNFILSAEQTNQCTPYKFGGGCNGGLTETAFDYIESSGLNTDDNYPYTKATYEGVTGQCTANARDNVLSITGYTTIKGETNMANYVQGTGPLSVCVAAEVWNTYRNGILANCPGGVDHCVQAVGVDTGVGGYWKVRNSWGTSWGEVGFIRIKYGENACKINDDPIWVVPKAL